MVVSQVCNEITKSREAVYGDATATTEADWGYIESFSYTEEETVEQIGTVGGGATFQRNEPGLYKVTGTLTTKVTKASLPELLEGFFGGRTDTTDYAISHDEKTIISYVVQAQHSRAVGGIGSDQIATISGLVFTTLNIDAAKDGFMIVSCDFLAQKLVMSAGTISTTLPTESLYSWLDISGSYGGTALKANSYSLNLDWNVDPNDGRGLESVSAGSRRLIQRVIKNTLLVSGSIDVKIEDALEFGYEDEKTDQTLVLTTSRGTDNEHTFTVTGCDLDNKSSEMTAEAGVKNFTADVLGRDMTAAGDL